MFILSITKDLSPYLARFFTSFRMTRDFYFTLLKAISYASR